MTAGTWLVVGLGNPGREYEATRHNIGFMVVDTLARRAGVRAWSTKFKGEIAQVSLRGSSAFLLKPLTYMNLSGQSVQAAMAFYKIPPSQIVVVHDELDLELGQLKLKRGGSAAGHNGIKSIDAQIGPEYLRVRAGIGHPRKRGVEGNVVPHVLGPFRGKDAEEAAFLVEACADAVEVLVTEGLEKAQMKFHGLKKP